MHHPASLPFDGGPIYAVVFWLAYLLWVVTELVRNQKRRPAAADKRDRKSFMVLRVALSLALILDFAFALLLPGAAFGGAAYALFVAGIGCILAGMALRGYAVAVLGRFFTVEVATRVGQEVIEAGPYRYIRHPAYTGALLSLIGITLALGNWAGVIEMLVLSGPAFGYRIAVEEAALLSALGEPYAHYMRRTWRLVPGMV